MATDARLQRILLTGFLAAPLLAQSTPVPEQLDGKNIEQIMSKACARCRRQLCYVR